MTGPTMALLTSLAMLGAGPRSSMTSCEGAFKSFLRIPMELSSGLVAGRGYPAPWIGAVRLKPTLTYIGNVSAGLFVGGVFANPGFEEMFGIHFSYAVRGASSFDLFGEFGAVDTDLFYSVGTGLGLGGVRATARIGYRPRDPEVSQWSVETGIHFQMAPFRRSLPAAIVPVGADRRGFDESLQSEVFYQLVNQLVFSGVGREVMDCRLVARSIRVGDELTNGDRKLDVATLEDAVTLERWLAGAGAGDRARQLANLLSAAWYQVLELDGPTLAPDPERISRLIAAGIRRGLDFVSASQIDDGLVSAGQVIMASAVPDEVIELAITPEPRDEPRSNARERWYSFELDGPAEIVLETTGRGDLLGALYRMNEGELTLLERDDDSGPGLNPRISRPLPPGSYRVLITEYNGSPLPAYSIVLRVE